MLIYRKSRISLNYCLYCAVELPCITMTAGAYFLEIERKLYKSLNEAEIEQHNLWHDRNISGLGFSARDFNEYTCRETNPKWHCSIIDCNITSANWKHSMMFYWWTISHQAWALYVFYEFHFHFESQVWHFCTIESINAIAKITVVDRYGFFMTDIKPI